MSLEIKVPVLPESINEATVATWHKAPGELVKRDENLVDIETDKIVLEVVAPRDGKLDTILQNVGAKVKAQEVIAIFSEQEVEPQPLKQPEQKLAENNIPASPAVRRLINENNLPVENLTGSGKHNSITREDINAYLKTNIPINQEKRRSDHRVPMTSIRKKIAERLVQAQQNAAILTTFNEINMQHVMQLRTEYKDKFDQEFGVKLGYMSFFVIAVVEALKKFPLVNAFIEGNDIIYHDYYDIGVAVASTRGLVVPVLRNAENMSMATVEAQIKEFGQKANNGKLTLDEIQGGTFTISNGGIFGSLMSTPILNPPQSGILGMHKIVERVVVENGNMVIRPMMYVALSYDHRIIDGADAVRFLLTVKEVIEDPARLLLGI